MNETPKDQWAFAPSGKYLRNIFVDFASNEKRFLILLLIGFTVAGLVQPFTSLAAWLGFLFAAYAVVANDSIQTIGTFIASNKGVAWWKQWLWIGGIFLVTVLVSWLSYNGDVTYERLAAKGFEEAPTYLAYLQIVAPLFLIILTRLKIPVSTTFLILTSFAASSGAVASVLTKSLSGYGLAFVVAIVVWGFIHYFIKPKMQGEAKPYWRVIQWGTTGWLWSLWITQDAANIAVYLPRSLSLWQFVVFAGVMFLGLAFLFKMGGEKIQEIVDEKHNVVDTRSATIIDLVYGFILWYFKAVSNIPMSTTWVFLGLLAGRELMVTMHRKKEFGRTWGGTFAIIGKDLGSAALGLAVSLAIAVAVNPSLLPFG